MMSTQAEVDAYYAEVKAGKQRLPSTQEEAFAKKLWQEDERPGPGGPSLASGEETTTRRSIA